MTLLDGPGMLHAAWLDFLKGTHAGTVAGRFHNTIVRVTVEALVQLSKQTGVTDVVLSGGCFQNVLLTERLIKKLQEQKLQAYVHRLVPPNDGCIAYGQAVVAGWKAVNL
jgi:hydrogenase maturation protein HypF